MTDNINLHIEHYRRLVASLNEAKSALEMIADNVNKLNADDIEYYAGARLEIVEGILKGSIPAALAGANEKKTERS